MSVERRDSITPPPKTLGTGRYELIEKLGQGGIASVWRAWDNALKVNRAIKLLSDKASRSANFRSRFQTEARTMARLEHGNILRVYDYGSENGRYYLVMEVLSGGSVADLLEDDDPVATPKALRIVFELCKALSAVHSLGAIHRDVKPGNMLIATDGSIRLSDFGIVRLDGQDLLHKTHFGDRLGTRGYMPPEQQEDARNVTPLSDIYSAGATLFALVTLKHPMILQALDRRPKLLENVHPTVASIIRRAVAEDPADRFQTAREMALEVVRAYDEIVKTEAGDKQGAWMAELDRDLATMRAHLDSVAEREAEVEAIRPQRKRPSLPPGSGQSERVSLSVPEPTRKSWPVAQVLLALPAAGTAATAVVVVVVLLWLY